MRVCLFKFFFDDLSFASTVGNMKQHQKDLAFNLESFRYACSGILRVGQIPKIAHITRSFLTLQQMGRCLFTFSKKDWMWRLNFGNKSNKHVEKCWAIYVRIMNNHITWFANIKATRSHTVYTNWYLAVLNRKTQCKMARTHQVFSGIQTIGSSRTTKNDATVFNVFPNSKPITYRLTFGFWYDSIFDEARTTRHRMCARRARLQTLK